MGKQGGGPSTGTSECILKELHEAHPGMSTMKGIAIFIMFGCLTCIKT